MAHRLLLADDSITIQKVVELVLAEEDFEIKSVSNGDDALRAAAIFRPDIILADIDMPKVNGYQLCEKIKQNPDTAMVPVILLAGAFEPIDEELARQVGADDSVVKPFESQELISKINAALTMATSAEEATVADEDAGLEAVELAEEAEAVTAEGVEVASAEEDLWAMEDIPAGSEAVAAGVAEEEATGIEAFELGEEEAAPALEAFAEAEPEKFVVPEPVHIEPAREPISRIAPSQPVREHAAPEVALPGREELEAIFRKSVDERVAAFLAGVDIKDALLASLAPAMKDSIDKVLWEVAPELVEKVVRETMKGAFSSLAKEIEKVIWETVPDLASTIITKEIEKIKAEF